jgi:hypothetical protein
VKMIAGGCHYPHQMVFGRQGMQRCWIALGVLINFSTPPMAMVRVSLLPPPYQLCHARSLPDPRKLAQAMMHSSRVAGNKQSNADMLPSSINPPPPLAAQKAFMHHQSDPMRLAKIPGPGALRQVAGLRLLNWAAHPPPACRVWFFVPQFASFPMPSFPSYFGCTASVPHAPT